MAAALYGPDGFFVRGAGVPAAHFRTSVHASPLFAGAVRTLAAEAGLDCVVDVGAGGGELLSTLHASDPHLHLVGVDIAPRPVGLPDPIGWRPDVPAGLDALVVANEWLDNVPLDVVQRDDRGQWRLVLVDPATGEERLGDPPDGEDVTWLAAWWPSDHPAPGARAEVGRTRDDAWAAVVTGLRSGLAVAIDYAHMRDTRPPYGTLAAYRHGRGVTPVPDGSCDITAHVALDSCAAAVPGASTLLLSQRDALRALGVDAARPPHEQARSDPAGYLRALSEASAAAELVEVGGLGSFTWLVQAVDRGLPQPLLASTR
jgi:SAM-dependent MidA family methyltransferase